MADFLGIGPAKPQKWEEGQRPTTEDLALLAERLGLSPRWLLMGKGDPQGQEDGPQVSDPLAVRVDTVAKAMRESGAAEVDILRSVRAMIDGEISKAMREAGPYAAHEPPAVGKAAEDQAGYGKDGELLTPPGRTKAAGGG